MLRLFDSHLPLEIIQKIFALCCRGVLIQIPAHCRSDAGNTQAKLSLVCSKWRRILLNTRELWSDVEVVIYLAQMREPANGSHWRVAHAWLSRAGASKISLSVQAWEMGNKHMDIMSKALFSPYKFTRLDFQFYDSPLQLPGDISRSHSLEELSLSTKILGYGYQNFELPRLPDMPSIKVLRFSLDMNDFPHHINLLCFPWHQLRVLDVIDHSWPIMLCLDILAKCESLVHCTLCANETGIPAVPIKHDIILPNLQSLKVIIDDNGSFIVPHLTLLHLQSIKTLEISSADWQPYLAIPLHPATIEEMARRSGFAHLTSFSMSLSSFSIHIRPLLRCMPALKSILLDGPVEVDQETFDDLKNCVIGPHLDELTLGVISDSDIECLLSMVRHRPKPFVNVEVLGCRGSRNLKGLAMVARRYSEELNTRILVLRNHNLDMESHFTDLNTWLMQENDEGNLISEPEWEMLL